MKMIMSKINKMGKINSKRRYMSEIEDIAINTMNRYNEIQ